MRSFSMTRSAGFKNAVLATIVVCGAIFQSPISSKAAVFPLSLSVQGIGIGALSGQSTLSNSTNSYMGGGFGAGFLGTLHITDFWALRGQANYLHFTGSPMMTAFPVTLGLEANFLQFTSAFYLYAAIDAGYNNTQALGTGGNNFTWDAALGLNLGPVYAEIRYAQIAGPLVTTNQGSLGSLSYIPVVVGFTFF